MGGTTYLQAWENILVTRGRQLMPKVSTILAMCLPSTLLAFQCALSGLTGAIRPQAYVIQQWFAPAQDRCAGVLVLVLVAILRGSAREQIAHELDPSEKVTLTARQRFWKDAQKCRTKLKERFNPDISPYLHLWRRFLWDKFFPFNKVLTVFLPHLRVCRILPPICAPTPIFNHRPLPPPIPKQPTMILSSPAVHRL